MKRENDAAAYDERETQGKFSCLNQNIEERKMIKYKNKIPMIAGILFLVAAVIAVSFSWLSGFHRYDLRLSFSAYVGARYSTSVLYFISALIMLTLLTLYIVKTKLPLVKRIAYAIVFLCIFGTALFPYNVYGDKPSISTIRLHNDCAIGLMLAVTVSFILSAILSRNKRQRMLAVLSFVYAVLFVALFFLRFAPLFQTIFIWENLFIVLLLVGLHMEQYGEIENDADEH